jgi:Domain of unknown function (DUF4189)
MICFAFSVCELPLIDMNCYRASALIALLLITMALPSLSRAHGALAIGIPENIALHGFSIGFAWDKPNADIARVDALRTCLDLQTATLQARGLCRVVTTFSRQCLSIANDPGGSGWGWGVDPSGARAQSKALASCVSTVRKSCSIAATQCDKTP